MTAESCIEFWDTTIVGFYHAGVPAETINIQITLLNKQLCHQSYLLLFMMTDLSYWFLQHVSLEEIRYSA